MYVAGKRPARGTINSTSPAHPTSTPRVLLWVTDQASDARYLIDTGATVSIVPPPTHFEPERLAYDLLAANGTPIATYGTQTRRLTLAPNTTVTWPFIIADVSQAILGMDFLGAHDLLVDTKDRQLIHKPSNTSIRAVPGPEHAPIISQLQPASPFSSLLQDFRLITAPHPQRGKVAHGVTHSIVTTGPPSGTTPGSEGRVSQIAGGWRGAPFI